MTHHSAVTPAKRLRAPRLNRASIGTVTGTVTLLGLAAMMALPTPYVLRVPGLTQDVLGTMDESDDSSEQVPVISVADQDHPAASGELLLTTVGVMGGPWSTVTAPAVLWAWASKADAVGPASDYYETGTTRVEVEQESQAQMEGSQDTAVVSALRALGYEVPERIGVVRPVSPTDLGVQADDKVHAGDVLEEGDLILSLAGTDITSDPVLRSTLAEIPGGTEVTATIRRDGNERSVQFVTYPAVDGAEGSRLGIMVQTTYDTPVDVTMNVGDVGGPSAGLMLALGVYQEVGGDELAPNTVVAGTGVIGADGSVTQIGGIRQKMVGAARAGATVFLAPESNCDEVIDHEPDSVRVVPVASLDDALAVLADVRDGDLSALPSC